MTTITHESDPVSVGIREWQKVKLAAEEAVARCKKAEDENAFLRGQNELLTAQKKDDDTRIRSLQQHCDEMELLVQTLGEAVISVIEKRKAGFFRRAGSMVNGEDRLRNAKDNDLENSLRELAARDERPRLEVPKFLGQKS